MGEMVCIGYDTEGSPIFVLEEDFEDEFMGYGLDEDGNEVEVWAK